MSEQTNPHAARLRELNETVRYTMWSVFRLDRVATARSRLPATLRLAGAGYDGVGIAACAESGQAAADQVADARG